MFPSKLALSTHPVPLTLYKMSQLTICYGGREEGRINPFYSFNHVLVHNGVRPFSTNSSCYKTCTDTFVSQQVVLTTGILHYTQRVDDSNGHVSVVLQPNGTQPNYKIIIYLCFYSVNYFQYNFR